jgi:hypothetical protein
MPDEYLPPNKTLFLQNLPETITKDDLEVIFKAYPNLHDVRLIPGRKGIAFVEYTDEASSTVAREALHNYKVDEDHKMKVGVAALWYIHSADVSIFHLPYSGHICEAVVRLLYRCPLYCIIVYLLSCCNRHV